MYIDKFFKFVNVVLIVNVVVDIGTLLADELMLTRIIGANQILNVARMQNAFSVIHKNYIFGKRQLT